MSRREVENEVRRDLKRSADTVKFGLDPEALESELRHALMVDHGCILHNGPNSGPWLRCRRVASMALRMFRDHINHRQVVAP